MADIEIGIFKSGRRAYGFDDIAIVPSRRTRDPEDVDISWEIDAYKFELPLLGAAMDGVMSPATAIEMGRLGGLGVLNLEGLWTRYEDPTPLFDEIRELDDEKATSRMQQMYQEPIIPELVTARIREMKEAGVTTAASVTPQRTEQLAPAILAGELDMLVIQGTVVSAEHVSKTVEPLNLKRFIREFDIPVIVGRVASYQAALHLMRTGAVGVLVGVGPATPARPAACRPRRAAGDGDRRRGRRPDAPPGRDRRVRARHRRRRDVQGGDVAKAITCGADAVMLGSPLSSAFEAPARGFHWGMATFHPTLPRGARVRTGGARARLREILLGPAHENDGRMNLFGALRTAMATCGYETVKEFQKAEVMIAPALQTEGKAIAALAGCGDGPLSVFARCRRCGEPRRLAR